MSIAAPALIPTPTSPYLTSVTLLVRRSTSTSVLLGDFNLPEIRWDLSLWPTTMEPFIDAFYDNSWVQLVDFPTRFHNILDLVFMNESEYADNVHSEPSLSVTADHLSVVFDWLVGPLSRDVSAERGGVLNWRRADWPKLCSIIRAIDFRPILETRDVETNWRSISTSLKKAIEHAVPFKPSGKRDRRPIWANQEAWKALKAKHNAYRRFKRVNSAQSFHCFKQASLLADQACQVAVRNYELRLCDNLKTDTKSLFAYATYKRGRSNNKIGPFRKADGFLTVSTQEDADLLSKYFHSVFNLRAFVPPADYPYRSPAPPLLTVNFDAVTVLNTLRGLKSGSCPGPDQIPYSVLLNSAKTLALPLSHLFNRSMQSGIVPSGWKHAIIQPIHKGGSRLDPSNFRPISLTSTISKVMESIVRDHMLDYITRHRLLNPSQHGFLPGRSTVTQMLYFIEFVVSSLDAGDSLDCVFLDFRKAFDSVNHKALLFKLHSYGFQGELLAWIESFLTARSQQVRVSSSLSSSMNVESGVPQGTILGPLLFTIFADDMDSDVLSRLFKYADDAKIGKVICRSSPVTDCATLQSDLGLLESWSSTWLMDFNVSKCSCLHFGRHNPKYQYSLFGHDLHSVDYAKDLGIWLTPSCSFSLHCGKIAARADQIINLIRRSFSTFTNLSFINLHRSIIRPLVEYATSVWCPHYQQDIQRIEGVQRRATKLVPHLRYLPYQERLRQLNLQSLETRRERADLILVWKLVHGKLSVL